MQALYYQSSVELLKQLHTKKLSCVELTKILLAHIRQVNPVLNAVVEVQEALSVKQAEQADKAIANQQSLGKLHGLPVTIKDCCLVKDYRCTVGTQGWKNYQANTDSACVAALKKAGAIILGITNVPELCTAFETDNDLYGRTNNPYDLTKTPGGSSGGEASIIAAGGSPLGLGTDGGGSIRVPCHFTGIAGIKPTRGLLSRAGLQGIPHGLGWIDPVGTPGPMARYVEDVDLALSVLAQYNIRDPFSVPIEYGNIRTVEIDKLRVAFYTEDGNNTPQEEIQSIVKAAAKDLEKHCQQVIEKTPKGIEQGFELLGSYFFGGDRGAFYEEALHKIGTHSLSFLQSQFVESAKRNHKTSGDWMKLFERIGQFRWEMHAFLQDVDIIICPPCASTAKAHGHVFNELKDFSYTMPYNLTGWPAAVVRCGADKNNLPIGVQIVGRPWQDHVVLAVAKLLENHFGGWHSPSL